MLFGRKVYREQDKLALKTVLDTFFVPFYYTKNTRTDVFYNYTQRVNNNLLKISNDSVSGNKFYSSSTKSQQMRFIKSFPKIKKYFWFLM